VAGKQKAARGWHAREIHSQARADHAPVGGRSMETQLALAKDDEEHGGGVHVKPELPKENRSNFKKFDSKTLTNLMRDTMNRVDNR